MTIDLGILGNKLRRYREQFQLTHAEVANASGIAESDLQQYENGTKPPSGDEILVLADFYLCDYKFFISNEKLAPFEQTETLFRRHEDALSKEDRWAIQEILYFADNEAYLSTILGISSTNRFEFQKVGGYYKGHGQKAAAALRRYLGYSPNQIERDIYEDFRTIGILVYRRRLQNPSISGFFVRHPTAGDCVCVNYDEDIYRQRFTAAHEAAHAILDDEDASISLKSWSMDDLSEIRANTFASKYLMPPDFLQSIPEPKVWNQEKAIDWANRLKVSTTALSIALEDAQLISSDQASMIREVRVPAEEKIDPELSSNLSPNQRARKQMLLERGLSDRFARICFQAFQANLISRTRVVEILRIQDDELADIAPLYQIQL